MAFTAMYVLAKKVIFVLPLSKKFANFIDYQNSLLLNLFDYFWIILSIGKLSEFSTIFFK